MQLEVEVQAELDSLVTRKMGDGLKGKGEHGFLLASTRLAEVFSSIPCADSQLLFVRPSRMHVGCTKSLGSSIASLVCPAFQCDASKEPGPGRSRSRRFPLVTVRAAGYGRRDSALLPRRTLDQSFCAISWTTAGMVSPQKNRRVLSCGCLASPDLYSLIADSRTPSCRLLLV